MLQKVVTLFVRLLSEPLINYVKRMHVENKWTYLNNFFIRFGNYWHLGEYHLNKTLFKNAAYTSPKAIKSEVAIEKGISGFYEIVFYTIIISLPISQIYMVTNAEREQHLENMRSIISLEESLVEIDKTLARMEKRLREI